jgi:membrane dipeptidase
MLNLGQFRLFADDRRYATRVVDLVARAGAVDMLGLLTLDWPKLRTWHATPASFGATEFDRLRASGVRVFHPAVEPNEPDPYAAACRWMAGWNRLLAAQPEYLVRVDAAADFDRAAAEDRIGVILGFQNADHFRTLDDLSFFHDLGQRVSQLTYNRRNRLGSGCGEGLDGGLSPFGGEVVAAMNRLGMAIDVSHCGERTSLDACRASRQPVLITHSNCRALVHHPRCKSDEVLRAMAATGGVMGITSVRAFVREGGGATLEHVLDHFDHVARVAGVEHVGIGSDTDPETRDPRTQRLRPQYAIAGMSASRRVYDIAAGLLRRGFSEADVELVLGGNFRRALGQVWAGPLPGALPVGVPAGVPQPAPGPSPAPIGATPAAAG